MKSLLAILVSVSLVSQAALAKRSCGLPATTAEDSWVEISKSLDIGMMKKQELLALPTLAKQQLILSAHFESSKKPVFNNTVLLAAVEYLKESSEGGDLYLSTYRFGAKNFTYVQYYPGGNEGGYIFPYGTATLLAGVGDQDIVCQR